MSVRFATVAAALAGMALLLGLGRIDTPRRRAVGKLPGLVLGWATPTQPSPNSAGKPTLSTISTSHASSRSPTDTSTSSAATPRRSQPQRTTAATTRPNHRQRRMTRKPVIAPTPFVHLTSLNAGSYSSAAQTRLSCDTIEACFEMASTTEPRQFSMWRVVFPSRQAMSNLGTCSLRLRTPVT
jgi:hypothetical protein